MIAPALWFQALWRPRRLRLPPVLAIVFLAALAPLPAVAQTRYDTPWADVTAPSGGAARAIGGPSRGCIAGARPLAAEGEGFQVLRRWRNRYYGHPDLLAFLTRLGKAQAAAKFGPLLIGDMAQPRGGPMATGHRSHQTGIDADILFTPGPMAPAARESLTAPPSMLLPGGKGVDLKRFGPTQVAMLRHAARDPAIARIFVNFHLKKRLCQSLPPAERAEWLGKVRPWAGHDEHFHIRLHCPAGSAQCEDQDPIPAGDGCDDSLEAWFRPAPPPDPNAPKPPKPRLPVLPAACDAVLTAK
ncbi:penicillin-insensitive murein endopeptidase [Zavarzinia compransoris]|uniref:Penicillin-insensitive murein endopeptidase n=1 Tax=Zavarzinia compransoris TaxID=1264899 RepID=A0A317E5A4_9PROT|nr:penicillin-insensitive murein endopeptidase [Zavarzinia compransoris]PWR22179.1 penicillin-insensitive murein endopeptidase [Zavarzinia compransoris]TDP47068.1 murein endopeptidase [Zavarzinia compransoris]